MSSPYEKIEVVIAWRLVLDQNQKQMDGERYKDFLLATLVYSTEVRNTVPTDVIRADHIDQTHKQVFAIFGTLI